MEELEAAKRKPLAGTFFAIGFSLVALHRLAWSDSPQDFYKNGNQLYADGKFADAAEKYQAAADGGLKHWTLEYDLGNAYYRAGQIGKAILHYERSFRMNSGQSDVLYNLNLATTKAGDPELPSTALPALAWRLFYSLSINTLTILTSLLFITFTVVSGVAFGGKFILKAETALGLGLFFAALLAWLESAFR